MYKYLINLIGDIHQPWKTINRFTTDKLSGDYNGQLYPIKWSSDSSIKSLHDLWDKGFSKIQD